MIEVLNKINVYAVNGQKVASVVDGPCIEVKSHGIDNAMVTLCFGGTSVTVLAKDLHAAVTNATNTSRF